MSLKLRKKLLEKNILSSETSFELIFWKSNDLSKYTKTVTSSNFSITSKLRLGKSSCLWENICSNSRIEKNWLIKFKKLVSILYPIREKYVKCWHFYQIFEKLCNNSCRFANFFIQLMNRFDKVTQYQLQKMEWILNI